MYISCSIDVVKCKCIRPGTIYSSVPHWAAQNVSAAVTVPCGNEVSQRKKMCPRNNNSRRSN